MNKPIRQLLINLLLAANVRIVHSYDFEFGGNPLASHVSSADPSVHVWDNKLWMYTSKDGNMNDYGKGGEEWTYEFMDGYHVMSTTDMINWEDHGEVFHSRDSPWGPSGWMWAPCATRENGKYYLYYPHKDWEGEWRVGVAVADSPIGPFEDIGYPIPGAIGIDPMVFRDDNGDAYMYLNSARVAKLGSDMISLAESMRSIDYGPSSVQNDYRINFEEGSYMHKHNGKYYFSYSNSKSNSPTAYYGIGDSPYGPFEWKGALAGAKHSAPDHHSIIEFKGSAYYFYHMDTPWEQKNSLGWYGHRRIACFDKMYYSGEEIQFVSPTYFHVNAGGEGYTARDGTYFDWDLWYDRGSTANYGDSSIANTRNDELYQSDRHDPWFQYRIPMSNGRYDITFKFAEKYFSEKGKRVFDVTVENSKIISNLDIFDEAGAKDRAYDETHTVQLTDNEMNIEFHASIDNAVISAISIQRLDLPRDEIVTNPCSANPCESTETCNDLGEGNYECESEFPCEDSPCRNDEICVDLRSGLNDFVCQEAASACTNNPCSSGSECLVLIEGGGGRATCRTADGECFSGENKVEVQGKDVVRMDALEIGDIVKDSMNSFSKVYSFAHLDRDTSTDYLQIHFDNLEAPLEVSGSHMLFVSGRTVRASEVRVGDVMGSNNNNVVSKIDHATRQGLYAPVTYSGRIVVSGVQASNYVALLDTLPASVQDIGSHSIVSAHRLLCQLDFSLCQSETYTNGISNWVHRPISIVQQMSQGNTVSVIVAMLFAPIIALAMVVEQFLLRPMQCLGLVFLLVITAWLRCSEIRIRKLKPATKAL